MGLTLALLLAAGSRDARAVCSTRHLTLFEIFDTAELVAVAGVTRAPKQMTGGGDVDLTIVEQLKGVPAKTARARENGDCTAGFYNVLVGKMSKTALVFIGHDGYAVGYWSGVIDTPTPELMAAVRAYAKAPDDKARLEVLVSAMESPDQELAAEAGYYLADEPALVLLLDATQLDRIAATRGGDQWGPELVLTRVHGTHLAQMKKARTLPKDLTAIVAFDYERITSAEELARIIERDRAPISFKRVAAFERCERLHARRLERFSIYNSRRADRARWRALAKACRGGTPAP